MCDKCNGNGKVLVKLSENLLAEAQCDGCNSSGKSKEEATCKTCNDKGTVLREWCSGLMFEVDCPDCKQRVEENSSGKEQ